MKRQFELVEKVRSYDPTADEDAINRAYVFAMKAHGSQMRASGDPYFSHPVEVAYILTDLHLDTASIVTALLHDTVEDTDATIKDISNLFGEEVAQLVDGVTKLSRLESKSESAKQAENFRKLLVATSEDIRVLLVKLADRLHNMQTLTFVRSKKKRERVARETLEIYASLAERIGMQHLKEQLQDLAFTELFPDARESITERLKYLREEGKGRVEEIQNNLRKTIEEAGVTDFEITGREKRPYSIWRKMESKNISFEQLADIIAFRVIVQDVPSCYQALGSIHARHHTIPGHFKDYISTPKNNGYQSIHTAIIGPYQQRIEVQIRTVEMHEVAEYGVAAHWSYKQNNNAPMKKDSRQYRWIRELLEILEKSSGAEEFLEHTKLEMYHDQVFCFSPKGDIMPLPRGATSVDFAFAVHSAVGRTCVGAKVNGRIVPLRTKLRNGDQVEIITSKAQTPSPTWERFVVTGKARSEIRKFIRTQQRKEYINLGKAILVKSFRQHGKEVNDKDLLKVVEAFDKKEVDDIYAEVGEGILSRNQVLQAVYPNLKPANLKPKRPSFFSRLRGKKDSDKHAVPIKGLISGMAIHFAGCCHPIPGDAIVGIVATGKGVTIHTRNCETLESFSDTPERWIDVAWDIDNTDGGGVHVGRVKATLSHETGGLAALTNAIAKDDGNISNIKVINRNVDFFEILVDIEVADTEHLNQIISNLHAQNVVQSVERQYS